MYFSNYYFGKGQLATHPIAIHQIVTHQRFLDEFNVSRA
jgi:hypothetical protein